MYPEVLEESEAQAPGPPPFTLHLSDPNMSVDTPWGPPEEGRPSLPLPDDRGCEHCLEFSVLDLESAETSDLTLETSLSSDRALIQLWLIIS